MEQPEKKNNNTLSQKESAAPDQSPSLPKPKPESLGLPKNVNLEQTPESRALSSSNAFHSLKTANNGQEYQSAKLQFQQHISLLETSVLETAEDSYDLALAHLNLGRIEKHLHHFESARINFKRASSYLETAKNKISDGSIIKTRVEQSLSICAQEFESTRYPDSLSEIKFKSPQSTPSNSTGNTPLEPQTIPTASLEVDDENLDIMLKAARDLQNQAERIEDDPEKITILLDEAIRKIASTNLINPQPLLKQESKFKRVISKKQAEAIFLASKIFAIKATVLLVRAESIMENSSAFSHMALSFLHASREAMNKSLGLWPACSESRRILELINGYIFNLEALTISWGGLREEIDDVFTIELNYARLSINPEDKKAQSAIKQAREKLKKMKDLEKPRPETSALSYAYGLILLLSCRIKPLRELGQSPLADLRRTWFYFDIALQGFKKGELNPSDPLYLQYHNKYFSKKLQVLHILSDTFMYKIRKLEEKNHPTREMFNLLKDTDACFAELIQVSNHPYYRKLYAEVLIRLALCAFRQGPHYFRRAKEVDPYNPRIFFEELWDKCIFFGGLHFEKLLHEEFIYVNRLYQAAFPDPENIEEQTYYHLGYGFVLHKLSIFSEDAEQRKTFARQARTELAKVTVSALRTRHEKNRYNDIVRFITKNTSHRERSTFLSEKPKKNNSSTKGLGFFDKKNIPAQNSTNSSTPSSSSSTITFSSSSSSDGSSLLPGSKSNLYGSTSGS